uniref:Uncharacterized protein n=1 Tax=Rhizophora mucronata TaxID=61149 RepID=A0A2P2P920_RHIMU
MSVLNNHFRWEKNLIVLGSSMCSQNLY